ncbi:MAG: 16S rRNA (cytosine(967)-C(5))-methyltransferase RsmB [Clostridia bacterium]|nr:16S rRNA (cytosine(967)-C(5))-methyltransferase RsmB [Clostridia bacterium]
MAVSVRAAAASALADLHRRQGYSNIVLDELLKAAPIGDADRALLSRLFYGVIERRLTLDYVIGGCSSTPVRKMHPLVRETLRVAAYQILFMDRIPVSAAVNEAVTAVRTLKQGHTAGFVNAVLRAVSRRRDCWTEELPAGDEGLSLRYSCPRELIAFWRAAYGEERMRSLLDSLQQAPDEYVRVNTLLTADENFVEALASIGANHQNFADLPHCFRLNCAYLLNKLESEQKNWYYYQDIASQWACCALDARPGERIADVCAAPGGKSLTTAQYMGNTGYVLACDVYEHKCNVMAERARQYGIAILETAVRDAALPCKEELRGTFDRVICDVPCSGLGVIRRKPEIRYKNLAEFGDLPALQYTILENSAQLVRPGGVLQYSTCTLNPAENEEIARRFLREHPEFSPRILPIAPCFEALGIEPDYHITLFPPVHGSDGFFIAGFIKNEVAG